MKISAAPSGPLVGLRILDMSTVVAGPFAATLRWARIPLRKQEADYVVRCPIGRCAMSNVAEAVTTGAAFWRS